MSFLNPTPSLPKFAGPFDVGSTEFEIPVSEIIDGASTGATSVSQPWPEITTVKFRLFYPADADAKSSSSSSSSKESIPWVPGPQKQWIEAFSKFLGASLGWSSIVNPALSVLRLITIPAIANGPVLLNRKGDGNNNGVNKEWPLLIFSHGLAGNSNSYSSLCGWLASCGIIVVAPEHRDGSAPITNIRAADGTPCTAIRFQKHGYTPTPEVFNARNEQLRIRMWELDLIYTSLIKLNQGEKLSNYALPKQQPHLQISLANTMDFQPGHVSWVGHSFGAATMTQFVKSIYYYNSQPSLKGTKYEHDNDWRPLYTPSSSSSSSASASASGQEDILSQITPSSPIALLDVWTLPLHAPSTQWLWEKPLPCYDRVVLDQVEEKVKERPTTVSVISTEFFNWEALRHHTYALLSRYPPEALKQIEEDKAMSRATTPRIPEETHPSPRISTPPYTGAEKALDMVPSIETTYESLPPPSLCLDPPAVVVSADSDTKTLSVSGSGSVWSETNSYTPASLFSRIGDSATSSHTDLSSSLEPSSSSPSNPHPDDHDYEYDNNDGLCTPKSAFSPLSIITATATTTTTLGVQPRLFYIPYSAHLSQSDYGLLFPRLLRVLMKAVDAELIMRLNVRAVMQAMRNAGLPVENLDKQQQQQHLPQRKRWIRWVSSSSSSSSSITGGGGGGGSSSSSISSKWSKWSSWTANLSTTSVATATATVTGSPSTGKMKEKDEQHAQISNSISNTASASASNSDDILNIEGPRWKRLDVLKN